MLYIRIVFFALFISTAVTSCKKDKLTSVGDIPGLGGDTYVTGAIDKWINDSLTVPYNIAVKYKWDQFEFDVNKTVTPADEEKVIPVMDFVRKVWINTYVEEAGLTFFRKNCPKFFSLAGSFSYNSDGSVTLGAVPEGSGKVLLYTLNYFKVKSMSGYVPSDSIIPKTMAWVIEHEFVHILDQKIQRPVEFDQVCEGFYNSDWINSDDETARRDGFISAYGSSINFEDFAETISWMLREGKPGYDNIVNSITGTSVRGTTAVEAKARLRRKESLIVDYYKKAWNIDFYSLQAKTRNALEKELY